MNAPTPAESPFLTTSEAAELLQVSVATLRRWSTMGLLPSERTAGGHRRFQRGELERFVHRARVDDPGPQWAALMLDEGGVLALQAALLAARSRLGDWWSVVDDLFTGVLELYRRSERGQITQLQLLAAFEGLGRALARFDDVTPGAAGAPVLLVAAVPGDRLLHPLRAVSLCAREAGWRPAWAGLATLEEIRADLPRTRPDALVVSASTRTDPALTAPEVPGYCTLAAAASLPTYLLGAWTERPEAAQVQVGSFHGLAAWLAGHHPARARPGPAPREGATA